MPEECPISEKDFKISPDGGKEGPADLVCIGKPCAYLASKFQSERMRALISEEEASQYAAQEIIAAGGKADPKSEKSG